MAKGRDEDQVMGKGTLRSEKSSRSCALKYLGEDHDNLKWAFSCAFSTAWL